MSNNLQFQKRSAITQSFFDSLLMIKRSSTHILRNTDQLLGTFFQPIMFLVLFSAVFGGAISKALPAGVSYLNFLMAGIIVQTLAFGSTTTAIAVCNDLQKGIIDRFKSLPMSNIAVLNGHVISDLFRNGISTIIMLVVGFIMGFRAQANFGEWLIIIGLLALFTLTFSWFAVIIGVKAKSIEAVQWLTFVIIFPLTFASSAFVPTEGMNKYLKAFAENQPITQIIEAIRALMLGTPVGNRAWIAAAWCVGLLLICVPLATYFYSKKSR
jgi:ABC-2 type transport system permease protein